MRLILQKFWIILLILGLLRTSAIAQDIHFSQYDFAPLNVNPAYTGLFNGDYRLVGNFRTQWFSVPVPYSTFSATADMHLLPERLPHDVLGFGLAFNYDQAGDGRLSTLNARLSLAYTKKIVPQLFFSTGAQFGFGQRRLDVSQLTFDDQFNGDIFDGTIISADLSNIQQSTIIFADIAWGMNIRYQKSKRTKLNIGVAMFNLNAPKQSFLGDPTIALQPRIITHFQGSFKVHTNWDILPTLLYQSQGSYREWVATLLGRYHLNENPGRETALLLGTSYRWGDAAIVMMGLEYQTWYWGLSYDINTSGFMQATNRNGAIEIALRYIGRRVPSLPTAKTCPIF